MEKKNNFGLTTTKAPFIEKAQIEGRLFIEQPYELYNEENQQAWRRLYALIRPKWDKFATEKFRKGIESLCLNPNRIPKLEEINQFLKPLTGFRAKAVAGYVSPFLFFECLKRREFPTTITIRDHQRLDYLPEPDIFHDIAGHVPMHTDPTFAEILVKFGSLAEMSAKRHAKIKDRKSRVQKIQNAIRALSRFFWFTIEFGLMKEKDKIFAYGSGLLSSLEELEHAVTSPEVTRIPFDLQKVINQPFEIDHFQPLLFVIDSFEHLYREVTRLENWLLSGKLDQVTPGAPDITEEEILPFLEGGEGE